MMARYGSRRDERGTTRNPSGYRAPMNLICRSRREQRRVLRRREILDVAQQYFLDHGFSDTSMSAIASRCGGSKTMLWSHFPSKEALFGAFVDRIVGTFSDALDEALLTGRTTEALTGFGCVFLSKILSEEARAIRRLIVAEGHRFPGLARKFYESGPMRTRLRLARFIATEMEANRLRPGEADLASRSSSHCVRRAASRTNCSMASMGCP